MKTQLKENQIEDTIKACPYCGDPKRNKRTCCGEVHFEPAYVTADGSIYLASETEVLKEAA